MAAILPHCVKWIKMVVCLWTHEDEMSWGSLPHYWHGEPLLKWLHHHEGQKFRALKLKKKWTIFKKINLKMSSAKWQPFCPGLNVISGHATKELDCKCAFLWVFNYHNFNKNFFWQITGNVTATWLSQKQDPKARSMPQKQTKINTNLLYKHLFHYKIIHIWTRI